jgi:molybdopterin converting factor subunit 1
MGSIHVRFFAQAREMAGCDALQLDLSAATVGDLRQELTNAHPALAGLLSRSAVAVNCTYVADWHPLQAGDEVAVIPPVAGG